MTITVTTAAVGVTGESVAASGSAAALMHGLAVIAPSGPERCHETVDLYGASVHAAEPRRRGLGC